MSAFRPRSDASYYSAAEPQPPSGLAMWSATNPGDYGASLRDSTIFRRPMSSGTAVLDRYALPNLALYVRVYTVTM